ncbi:hypothetical protein CRUP_036829 [Coryphaenoides rupestris]|nr:hypothetical protein CRUP_036829 [Coryphaenoides rupestris]
MEGTPVSLACCILVQSSLHGSHGKRGQAGGRAGRRAEHRQDCVTMNSLSSALGRAPDHPRPLCVPELPRGCHPRFSPVSRCLSPGSMLGHQSPHRPPKSQRDLSPEEQQELRRKINSRERRRMQDLNVAMDALREVMVPYASSSPSSPSSPSSSSSSSSSHSHHPGAPPGRRLSKISTLVLARNYILLLGSSLQEMRQLLGEVSVGMGGVGPGSCCHLLLSPESLLTTSASSSSSSSPSHAAAAKCTILPPGPVEPRLAPVQWSSVGTGAGGSLCPCSVCPDLFLFVHRRHASASRPALSEVPSGSQRPLTLPPERTATSTAATAGVLEPGPGSRRPGVLVSRTAIGRGRVHPAKF